VGKAPRLEVTVLSESRRSHFIVADVTELMDSKCDLLPSTEAVRDFEVEQKVDDGVALKSTVENGIATCRKQGSNVGQIRCESFLELGDVVTGNHLHSWRAQFRHILGPLLCWATIRLSTKMSPLVVLVTGCSKGGVGFALYALP
jgi:hypothetical protein